MPLLILNQGGGAQVVINTQGTSINRFLLLGVGLLRLALVMVRG